MTAGLILEVVVYGAIWLWLLALIPAAVVTVLKERLLLFLAGWLTFGIAWFLGAIPLADPGSGWARTFYGDEKLARAAEPMRHPRPRRTTRLWLGSTAALVLVIGLAAARPAPIVGVDGKALQYSISGGSILTSRPCPHKPDGTWSCSVPDRGYSSAIPYRVRVGGLGCWTATSTLSTRDDPPRRLEGCITVRDQIRLSKAFSRLSG
jgi:hypothetical protein